MIETIQNLIQNKKYDKISNYVKNHLPNDSNSLNRIYNQLLTYKLTSKNSPQKIKQTKIQQKTKVKESSQKITNKQDQYTHKSQKILKILKEKGYKITSVTQQQSLKLCQKQKIKLIDPLQVNQKILTKQQDLVDKLILRYEINKNIYTNNIDDAQINVNNIVDPDMDKFITWRQKSLKNIQAFANQYTQKVNHSTYNNLKSRLFSSKTKKSIDPPRRKYSVDIQKVNTVKDLLSQCSQQLNKKTYKKINVQKNVYKELEDKIEQKQDLSQQNIFNMKKIKQKLMKQQYQRYNHSYNQMMNEKIKQGSICKMNKYAKDLIQDEKKMRDIIDFSKN